MAAGACRQALLLRVDYWRNWRHPLFWFAWVQWCLLGAALLQRRQQQLHTEHT
jgi:hypothetical protein